MAELSDMRWYRLSPSRNERGVSCDAQGAFVGPVPLLAKTPNGGSGAVWTPRPTAEINAQLGAAYGLPIDFSAKSGGLSATAQALNSGELARAQAVILQLHLPDLPPLAKAVRWDEERTALLVELYASDLLPPEWAQKVARFDPTLHPRWPLGDDEGRGGQFRPKDGDLLISVNDPEDPSAPGQAAPPQPRTATRDKQKPPAELPTDRPPTQQEINRYARQQSEISARQVRAGVKSKSQAIGEFLDRVGASDMIGNAFARFVSRFDNPVTLDELIVQTQTERARKLPSYETHHIVEQTPNKDTFSEEQLESPRNVVRIPYYRHRDISDFYSRKCDELGDRTPRDYLRGKSFEEQYKFGVDALRKYGVIK